MSKNMTSGIPNKLFAKIRKNLVRNPYIGSPYEVQIEITTKCNLTCQFCLRNSKESDTIDRDMPLDLFESIINGLRYPTRFISLVGLGEPLLNPELFSMIRLAKKKGFEVSLIDNFTLIDKDTSLSLIRSGLDHLYVSFDGASKTTFERMRTGAVFDKVKEAVKLFVATKKDLKASRPIFYFKSTICKDNFAEIPHLIKLAEDLGVDGINFGKLCAPTEDYANDVSISLELNDLPKSKIEIVPCELSKTFPCCAPRGCYVSVDGKVLPCGLLCEITPRKYFSHIQLGDVKSANLGNIWRSSKYRRFRREIASGKLLPLCKKCPAWRQP